MVIGHGVLLPSRTRGCCSEGNQRHGAEAALAPAAAHDEPLDPASGSAGLNEQVQAVAIGVPCWRGGTDEGRREHPVRMASSALGSGGGRSGSVAAKTIRSGRRATLFRCAISSTRLRLQRIRTAPAPRQHVHGEGVESRVPLTRTLGRVTAHLSNARIPVPRGDRDESRSALYKRLMSLAPVRSEQEHRAEVLHDLQATHSAARPSGSSFGDALLDPLGGKVAPRLVVTRVLAQDAVKEPRTILNASRRTPISLVVHDDVVPT